MPGAAWVTVGVAVVVRVEGRDAIELDAEDSADSIPARVSARYDTTAFQSTCGSKKWSGILRSLKHKIKFQKVVG